MRSLHRQHMPKGDRDEEAAFWVTQLMSDDCSAAIVKASDVWRSQSEDNEAAFVRARDMYQSALALIEDPALLAARRDVLARSFRTRRGWGWPLALTAGLCAVALFGVAVTDFRQALPPAEAEAFTDIVAVSQPEIYETSIGEQSEVVLQDGSTVLLNTNTAVRATLTGAERRLILLRGQAIFKVAHDETRPFVVFAGGRRITALGTEFEVRLDRADVEVTLLEGRVVVDEVVLADGQLDVPERKSAIELKPGERLKAKATQAEITTPDIERELSWREGRLEFYNEPLADILTEFNRYSNLTLQAESPSLEGLRISGSFRMGSTENFVVALTAAYPLVATTEDDTITIRWAE